MAENERAPGVDDYAGPGRVVIVLFLLLVLLFVVTVCGGTLFGLAGFVATTQFDKPPDERLKNLSNFSAGKTNQPGTFLVLDWQRAFSPGIEVDEQDRAAIERLFETLLAASESGNDAGVRDCFDDNRRFEEIAASRLWPYLPPRDMAAYRAALPADDLIPRYERKFKIVSVRRAKREGEVVVSGYFWYSANDPTAMQWRLVRRGRWRVFDAAEYGLGMSYGKRQALANMLALHSDPGGREFTDAIDSMTQADELSGQQDLAGAKAKLRSIKFTTLRDDLADDLRVELAMAWVRLGDMREAIAVAESVKDKSASGGAHLALATAYDRLGRHEKVLESTAWLQHFYQGTLASFAPLEAQALEALDRPKEAASAWQTALAADAEWLEALTGLARTLSADRQSVLRDHLKSLSKPLETCDTLLAQSYRLEENGAPELLAKLIGELAPGSAAAALAEGRLALWNDEYETAAAHFARAASLETDKEKKRQHVYQYLGAMLDAEQIVRAYREGPDPDSAFEYFLDMQQDEDYEIDPQTMRELLAARREKHSEDPRAYLLSGRLFVDADDYAAAEREFAAGLAKTDDEELREVLESERSSSLAALGRAEEAYRAAADPEASFRTIAGELRAREKLDELARLIELHRAKHPSDPWLDFHAGYLATRRKDWNAAERHFSRGEAKVTEDWLKPNFRGQRIEALVDGFGIAEAYRRLGPNANTFVELARRFQYLADTAQLEQLVAAHRQAMPYEPHLPYWEAELFWRKKNYEKFLHITRSMTPANWSVLDEFQSRALGTNMVRALVRTRRVEEAVALGQSRFHRNPFAALLAHAAAGNVDKTAQLMREQGPRDYLNPDAYQDVDLGPLLWQPRFLPVREEFPPQIMSYTSGTTHLVLLLGNPLPLDEAKIRGWLPEKERSQSRIQAVVTTGEGEATSLAVQFESFAACLTAGTGPYASQPDLQIPKQASEEFQKLTRTHDGWLSIAVSGPRGTSGNAVENLARQIVASVLATEGTSCLAVYAPDRSRLMQVDEKLLARLRSGEDAVPAVDDDSREVWFLSREPDYYAAHYKEAQRRRREFRAAWAERKPEQKFSVQVAVTLGLGSERLWLDVKRRKQQVYGGGELHGHLAQDSLLRPELKAGEPVRVYEGQLVEWRVSEH